MTSNNFEEFNSSYSNQILRITSNNFEESYSKTSKLFVIRIVFFFLIRIFELKILIWRGALRPPMSFFSFLFFLFFFFLLTSWIVFNIPDVFFFFLLTSGTLKTVPDVFFFLLPSGTFWTFPDVKREKNCRRERSDVFRHPNLKKMAPGTSRTFPNVQIKKKRRRERLERFPTLAIFFNFSYQKRETNSNSNYSNYSNSSSLRILRIICNSN